MATGKSGSFNLAGNNQFTAKINWSETYDVAANTSVVSVSGLSFQTASYAGTYYLGGTISINGTAVVTMSYLGTATHYVELYVGDGFVSIAKQTGTLPPWSSGSITHNSDGSKSVTIAVDLEGWREDGHTFKVTGSQTVVLTTIPRTSTLTASNGTLGTAQTLTITRQASSFTHTITYACGTASGTIATKTTSTSVSFTPPFSLSSQNTTGTSVSITFTLSTYSGSTLVGSSTKTISCTMPASVKPSCSITVSDPSGHVSAYGGYIQGVSSAGVTVSATQSYSSPISSYVVTADGKQYNASSATISSFSTAGGATINATVTDKRSRSGTASKSVTVLAYSRPSISALSVHRCNSDGTENSSGTYAKVTYSFAITSLSSKNAKTITLKYKKSSATSYTSVAMTSAYSATNSTYVFAAEDGSSYDVVLTVADAFVTTEASTSVSTAVVIMHYNAAGNAVAFGKISEKTKAVEFGWATYYNGKSFLDMVYPVGAIYLSVGSTSPASLFGGTWTQITNTFLLAAGSSYAAGSTGGAATVTLTVNQIPSHSHDYYVGHDGISNNSETIAQGGWYGKYHKVNNSSVGGFGIQNAGGGGAHNNMPPYLAVYVWKRTA